MYEVGETGASDGSRYEKRVDARGRESEPACIDDEILFEIPEGWAWCRYFTIADTLAGFAFKSSDFKPTGKYRLLRGINLGVNRIRWSETVYVDSISPKAAIYELKTGDVLLGLDRPWISDGLRTATIEEAENTYLVQRVLRIRQTSAADSRWLQLLLTTPLLSSAVAQDMTGISVPHISERQVASIIVPLPPINEQRRIVDLMARSMPLIDDYGALESARERLDAELPGRLRKSVLQLAVQGGLVEQDPDDEPASVLLDRIRAERAKLIKEKKIRAPKGGESVIWRASDGGYYEKRGKGEPQPIEVPFDIPESWAWTRLKSLGKIVGGGTPKTHDASLWASPGDGTPWITPADMKNVHGRRVSHGGRYLSEKGLAGSSAKLMPAGTVVMSSRAPIGYLAITECPIATNQDFKSIVPTLVDTNAWIMLALDALMDDIKKRASGTTFKEISGTEFGDTLVPLPPLSEQARIVACSESVMAAIG